VSLMIGSLVGLWARARSLIRQRKTLSLFVLGIALGLQAATMFWTWSFARQVEILKQENQLQRSISELNSRIRDQNREEPFQQKERSGAVPTPGIRPKTDVATGRTPPQLPEDVESARIALRYVEGAREYSRRGEEVRAIEAYVSAAQALPKAFLNRRGIFPAVDLNDREARSKLLAAFQNLFAETTLDRLREIMKGN
jgi:hypothetical protein